MTTTTWKSTNGRWGAQLVHPTGTVFPAQGTLRSLGQTAGLDSFEFVPAQTGTWVVTGSDLEPVAGCEVAYRAGLQSSDWVTLLVAQIGAVWRAHGYKQRSSRLHLLTSTGVSDPPPAVLLALGAIAPTEGSVRQVPAPPAFKPAVAQALREAGLLK